MWFPSAPLLGLVAQVPLTPLPVTAPALQADGPGFMLKSGAGVFTPKDMMELVRPGTGTANEVGDLVLVHVSKYSFKDKKNRKSLFFAPLESSVEPLEVSLETGGEAFWLNADTVGHVVPDELNKTSYFYAISVKLTSETLSSSPPVPLGTFPTTSAANFRYAAKAGVLVFTDSVYPDGKLTHVRQNDKAWERRGNTALVYDQTFERHWDTWRLPKRPSLFTVRLTQDGRGKWHFGDRFIDVLHGTGHHTPVGPFGGTDNFDISDQHIVYTTKDPRLPEAEHTKQNIYVVDFAGHHAPRELTSGMQGATTSPVFNADGDKVAWLEQDEDGYESDRFKIVIYDSTKDVRYTITQPWDRSPDSLAFSPDSAFIYLTAPDFARTKVFVLPVPETPDDSTTHPDLPPYYTTPQPLTNSGVASGIQILPKGRLMYTRSSRTSPNDVFILPGLQNLEARLTDAKVHVTWDGVPEQVTRFAEDALKGKNLTQGEDFFFQGAEGKSVHGYVQKPKGWKVGGSKKWPVVLMIHGGPQDFWADRWSIRFNPLIFAHQGYFAVMIDPTGSISFGQEFTDAVKKDYGGRPFVDFQKGWRYALETYPEIDAHRAVAVGGSWGGYAINWIQGHPEYNFSFKALVSIDGLFDVRFDAYGLDELFFLNHEFGGRPWEPETEATLAKFNPANYVHKWSTPELILHGSKDYRVPEVDGIAAFHALQQRGVPSRLVIFPDENHWISTHGNSLKWHQEIFRWFNLYVGTDDGAEE